MNRIRFSSTAGIPVPIILLYTTGNTVLVVDKVLTWARTQLTRWLRML